MEIHRLTLDYILYCIYPFLYCCSQHEPFRSATDYGISYHGIKKLQLHKKLVTSAQTSLTDGDLDIRNKGQY